MTPENQSSLNLVTTELIVDQLLGFFTEKNQQGGWRHTFLKTPWKFLFLYFIPGNSRQNKAPPLEIPQNCVKSLGNSKAKPPKPLEIPHYFFLVTLVNSFCYLFDNPGNLISSTPPPIYLGN